MTGFLGGSPSASAASANTAGTAQSNAAVSLFAAQSTANPYTSFEQEEEALENDYYFKESAWRQAQRLAEQAILNKYNADVAALSTNTALNASDIANQTATLKAAYDLQR